MSISDWDLKADHARIKPWTAVTCAGLKTWSSLGGRAVGLHSLFGKTSVEFWLTGAYCRPPSESSKWWFRSHHLKFSGEGRHNLLMQVSRIYCLTLVGPGHVRTTMCCLIARCRDTSFGCKSVEARLNADWTNVEIWSAVEYTRVALWLTPTCWASNVFSSD